VHPPCVPRSSVWATACPAAPSCPRQGSGSPPCAYARTPPIGVRGSGGGGGGSYGVSYGVRIRVSGSIRVSIRINYTVSLRIRTV
jgi:hypothetical protein